MLFIFCTSLRQLFSCIGTLVLVVSIDENMSFIEICSKNGEKIAITWLAPMIVCNIEFYSINLSLISMITEVFAIWLIPI